MSFRYPGLISAFLCLLAPAAHGQILTPKPPLSPRINGPKIYGARPDRPFLYRIPCTGQRPIQFAVQGLPATLKLDPATGILSGRTPAKRGTYPLTFKAANSHGKFSKPFRLVVGDTLSLTPSMGWNDWYTHYSRITDKLMRQGADAMIASGMADYGYEFVNIDDCWMVRPDSTNPEIGGEPRDASGAIRSNARFPDMKGLAAYIHSKGLKAGLYTSPGPLTCGRFTGSYQHEDLDARKFAEWGFDFLKYDWCSYGKTSPEKTLENYKRPYQLMGDILKKLDRDVVFNLCQYGMGDVWKWGGEVGGQSWRTTGDLGLAKDSRLPGFYSIGFMNAAHDQYAGPGRWNDPDYILIGTVGNAFKSHELAKATNLTPDEQYSYMSMWVLMSSPLFYGGDMNTLDEFTLNVLCNAEVIDVDQDPLGKQARVVRRSDDEMVMVKPMEDGSLAVGLFNLAAKERAITAGFDDLKISGKRKVRDLWRQRDLAAVAGAYTATVPAHGVSLVRLIKR